MTRRHVFSNAQLPKLRTRVRFSSPAPSVFLRVSYSPRFPLICLVRGSSLSCSLNCPMDVPTAELTADVKSLLAQQLGELLKARRERRSNLEPRRSLVCSIRRAAIRPRRLESPSSLRGGLRQPVGESLSLNFPSCFDLSVDASQWAMT